MAGEGEGSRRNIEPVNGGVGYPTGTVGGPSAPSCYRVSLLSGSLEVTARLKCVDDLDLLVKVLEANKAVFAKIDGQAAEVLNLTQELGDVAPSKPIVRLPRWRSEKHPYRKSVGRQITQFREGFWETRSRGGASRVSF